MNRRHIISTLLATTLILLLSVSSVFAQTLPVVKDNGTGNQYSQLATNYVQLKSLKIENAVIESGSGYSISDGWGNKDNKYNAKLMWTGKISYGGSNTTNDADASLKTNTLPSVTLRFPGRAKTSDGTTCDVLMTFKSIKVMVGPSRTDKIKDSTTVKVGIASGSGNLTCGPPRTAAGYATKGSTATTGRNAGCTTAHEYLIEMKIVNSGTNTAISSSAYPTMLVEFKDLDIFDKTVKKSASSKARANGSNSESIELVSGWLGNIVLGPDTNDLANTRLSDTQTTSRGNTRIKPDGDKLAAFVEKFNPPDSDYNTLWSGFVAAVKPQGFSFYWHAAAGGGNSSLGVVGTQIGGQPTVAVKAKRTNPGAAGATLGGNGAQSSVDSWYTNTHLMNSKATYSYKPALGWRMKYVKVDGVAQTLTDAQKLNGGSYIFTKLNKYPLPKRNIRTGQVLAAQDSGFYTIETAYEHIPDYTCLKNSDTAYIKPYDDKEITYTIRAEEIYTDAAAGTYEIKDDMANGLLILSGEPEVTVSGGTYVKNKADNTGLDYTFKSNDANGSKPHIYITYKAKVNWDAYFASSEGSIVNTCNGKKVRIGPITDLKITKEVTGKLRDTTKKFEFQVSLTGLNPSSNYVVGSGETFGIGGGAEITRVTAGELSDNGIISDSEGNITFDFKMSHSMGIAIKDLPVGAQYSVTEAASDHRASYKLVSDKAGAIHVKQSDANLTNKKILSTATETLDKEDGVVTVAFTNRRDPIVVLGVLPDNGWLMALGCVVIAIAGVFAVRSARRKRNDAAGEEVQDE